MKEARMGVHHRSFWERTIRQILSRPCKLFSCFLCPVFVLRQYVILFSNKIKKAYFLYIPFFFAFTSAVMGKSLCRARVYM